MMKLLSKLPGLSNAPAAVDWHATEPWVRFGNHTVFLLLGGLLLSSTLFSINGAVVASGTVSVEGEYQTVQHLEGGIISKILVRNGDHVKKDQVLIQLEDAQAEASMSVTSAKVIDYSIQEARLIAERDRKETFALPANLKLDDGDNRKIFEAQKQLFDARRTSYLGQRKVLTQKIIQADSELAGGESQMKARIREHDLNTKELETVRPLFEKGYVNQQRIGPLEREASRLVGEIGNLKAEMAKTKSARAEAEARLAQADKEYTQQAAEDLQKVQASLGEQREALKSSSDKVQRTELKAPASGVIHNMAVHTVGGVIQPGGTLLQIIPDDREFVIDAKIQPRDIESVHSGQPASVRFSSFDSHTTPKLNGLVRRVSAAEIADKDGKTYFTAEVTVPKSEIARLEQGQRLVPGMPAEVYMQTHERSILSYFLKPLGDMMANTFRER